MGEKKIHVQAHRGACSEFVENTLPSFERAVQLKVDSIELDVQLTKDAEVVVFHDFDITPEWCRDNLGNPLASSMPIWKINLAEIQELEIRIDRRLTHKRELLDLEKKIPTLREVFLKMKQWNQNSLHPIGLDIEIKRKEFNDPEAPSVEIIVQKVIAEINQYWDVGNAVVRSFDFSVLEEMKRQAPQIPIAVLTYQTEIPYLEICQKFHPKILAPFFKSISTNEISEVRAAGVEVWPYTVNTVQEFERMISAGVSGLTTDNPKGLIEFLNQ